jgi:hypothetical protein
MLFNDNDFSLIRFDPTSITSRQDDLVSGDVEIQELAEAKREELKLQIATALSQRKLILDARMKKNVAKEYESFSADMFDRIKTAIKLYSDGLKEAEKAPNEPSKRMAIEMAEAELKRKCEFIEDLSKSFLQNIYIEVINK